MSDHDTVAGDPSSTVQVVDTDLPAPEPATELPGRPARRLPRPAPAVERWILRSGFGLIMVAYLIGAAVGASLQGWAWLLILSGVLFFVTVLGGAFLAGRRLR